MILANVKYPFDTMLLASILDNLNLRTWAMRKDNSVEKPTSLVNKLLGIIDSDEREEMVFNSGQEFEEMRNRILQKGGI